MLLQELSGEPECGRADRGWILRYMRSLEILAPVVEAIPVVAVGSVSQPDDGKLALAKFLPCEIPASFIQRLWLSLFIQVPAQRLRPYGTNIGLQRLQDVLNELPMGMPHVEADAQPFAHQLEVLLVAEAYPRVMLGHR
jgi:hypothetical protein